MPEWPEMEHYRRMLESRIANRTVADVEIGRDKSVNLPPERFRERVAGRRVVGVRRKGKHLLFDLEGEDTLMLHLMLGGTMFFGGEADKPNRTFQVILSFGGEKLYFINLQLGYLHLLNRNEAEERLAGLGPDPFDPRMDEAAFGARLSARRTALKSALTDQGLLAGIGGCYSDEACFASELLPSRIASGLNAAEIGRLYAGLRTVLLEALEYGGYMEMPFFAGDTRTGGYNDRCRVYDREGEPCPRCGASVERRDVGSKKIVLLPPVPALTGKASDIRFRSRISHGERCIGRYRRRETVPS